MTGPYQTERQAAVDIADVYDIPPDRHGAWHGPLEQRLTGACAAAGVDLGVFDRRIVAWLAWADPATVQVVCDLITRAHTSGVARPADTKP